MASSIRSASSWLLVALPLFVAAASAAPPKPGAAGKEDPKAAARVLFDYAQREYDLGNFNDALSGYSEAYRLVPEPALLFNIGQCHRQLGQYERAAFFYRRYLALDPESPDAPLVNELIQTMEAKQAELEQQKSRQGPPLAVPLTPEAQPAERPSSVPAFLRSKWFWAGVGVVAVGATTTALLTRSNEPRANLGTVTVP
ncbi:tetratricopeptide repeat protein [Pyxidicoccus sp. MSG2]|uniref:tetratricopeptide repeat protein n=1 Tax=Pyxidicoccus sp. MSG2 TaxID=2996790 RepID=UPI002271C251|nr:tetratricopeptide repeat protein [Pyxidicoccus sp. MSG2]MCY1017282.1 tetratricopeptide repeat protein [Pyxidicoccus sp. MSG2]